MRAESELAKPSPAGMIRPPTVACRLFRRNFIIQGGRLASKDHAHCEPRFLLMGDHDGQTVLIGQPTKDLRSLLREEKGPKKTPSKSEATEQLSHTRL